MAAFEYRYKVDGLYKVSANTMGRVCEELTRSQAGLSEASLLDVSRPIDAPLHDEFEWDDKIAGEKYRLRQAGDMIRSLSIVTQTESSDTKPRAFVITPNKGQYTTLQHALNRDDLRLAMLAQAKRDAKQYLAKYRQLNELAGVVTALEEFVNLQIE